MKPQTGKRKLKPSGIDWIGDVPEGWGIGKVKFYYDIQLGKMLSSEQTSVNQTLERYYCAGDVHFDGVDESDLKEMWFDRGEKLAYAARVGDLLVVEGGAGAGGCAVVKKQNGDVFLQNSIMRLRAVGSTDNGYLCYWMESLVKSGYVDLVCNKATIPHFTKQKLGGVVMPLPPHDEQKRIAAKLDRLCRRIDELSANLTKEIAALQDYRKSLITECVTKGLNPKAKMKPSGVDWIGDVPEGWNLVRLKDIISVPLFYGAALSGDVYQECLPRYIRITDITEDGRLSDSDKLSLQWGDARPYLLKDQDILLARSGATAGKSFLYSLNYGPAAFAGYLICCRLDKSIVSSRYVYYTMLSHPYDSWRETVVTQATIPNISGAKFESYKLAIPPCEEQREIAAYLDKHCAAIDAKIDERQRQLEKLAEYRASAIYEYVTGKKEVAG